MYQNQLILNTILALCTRHYENEGTQGPLGYASVRGAYWSYLIEVTETIESL